MSDETSRRWPKLPLRSIATEMCLGKMLDKQKNRGTLQPYLRNVNVRWFSFDLSDLKKMRFEESEGNRFELREGDLVICEGGEPGRAAVWRGQAENAKIQKALHRVRFNQAEYDPTFAMYYLYFATITNRLASYYTGTTIKHLTGAALSQVHFPILSINEQRRIVAKIEELFSDLDAGVAALERAKANLKRYRASVLKAAVEGKLTEAWRAEHPHTEPASKLLERILAERRQKWEADQLAKFAAAGKQPPKNWRDKYVEPTPPDTTGLPGLPKGWCWASVEQLLVESTCNGISIKGSDSPPGIPALRLNAMTQNGFDYEERRYIPISDELASELAVRRGDMFVSRGNGSLHLVGRSVIAQEPPGIIVFPDTMIRLRLCDLGSLRELVNLVWASRLIRGQIEKKARTTAGIYKISQSDVEQFMIPVPPLFEQQQIVALIAALLSNCNLSEVAVDHSLRRASRLRQSILKQAFEGKLVPQDPTDEPASALLQRLLESNGVQADNRDQDLRTLSRGGQTETKQKQRRGRR